MAAAVEILISIKYDLEREAKRALEPIEIYTFCVYIFGFGDG